MKLQIALGLLLVSLPARAEVVKDWMDSANYPAEVIGIPIGNAVLSHGHPLRVGAWTIHFRNERVVATYDTMNMGMQHDCQSITTYNTNNTNNTGLICSNAVLGDVPCNFIANSINGKCINAQSEPQSMTCKFLAFNDQGSVIKVACPEALHLSR
jgi:hypothetical protein